jgi:hypothetical protein
MVFKSHYRAYEAITDYDYKADHQLPHRAISDLKSMLELLEKTTKVHVHLVEKIQLNEIAESQVDQTGGTTTGVGGAIRRRLGR